MTDVVTDRVRTWVLAQVAIDHVAGRLGVDRPQACVALKDALQDERIRARGPIVGANASEIPSEFWRFSDIDSEGVAVNLSSLQKLPWFEVNFDDVLRVWPPAVSPAETASAQPPRKAVSRRDLEPFVVAGKFTSCDIAESAARKHFVGRSVDRDLIRKIWGDNGLGGKRGRPRGGVS
jgi:hypothetical protein